MTKINKLVGIQFLKGKNENDLPEIRVYRSIDGKKGKAIYKFYNPRTITLDNFNSIKRMHLIDEEGELSTRGIDVFITNENIREVKSTYNWNTEKEFERFMRFAKRHANSLTNH